MSRLKISENLFLEVAEINRLVKFISEDGYKRLAKSFLRSAGIVRNAKNDGFQVERYDNVHIRVKEGIAFDTDLNAIVSTEQKIFSVNDSGVPNWVILSRAVTNSENYKVKIHEDGTLEHWSNSEANFTEILRGQPNFPTKVRFQSSVLNTGEYEVISVQSDKQALLNGNFIEEITNMEVIGTFTPGFLPDDEDKCIYEFDSYKVTISSGENYPSLTQDEFLLAKLTWENGELKISDERAGYMFNDQNNPTFDTVRNVNVSVENSSGLFNRGENRLFAFRNINLHERGETERLATITFQQNYRVSNIARVSSNTYSIRGSSMALFGDVPDNYFAGYVLRNLDNGEQCKIDGNKNNLLTINNFNDRILSKSIKNIIITPDYDFLEVKVAIHSGDAIELVNNSYIEVESKIFTADNDDVTFTYISPVDFEKLCGTNFASVHLLVEYRMLKNGVKTRYHRPVNNVVTVTSADRYRNEYQEVNLENGELSYSIQ